MRPPSWKISRFTAPAARAARSTVCASAKAASLWGMVTLEPLKPAAIRPRTAVEKSSGRTGNGTSAPSIPISFSQKPCSRGETACDTGQPMMPAILAAPVRLMERGSFREHALFAQLGQKRQERQAENGKIIACDAMEKLRAQPFQLVAANGGQHRRTLGLQVAVQERIGKMPHPQLSGFGVTPDDLCFMRQCQAADQ